MNEKLISLTQLRKTNIRGIIPIANYIAYKKNENITAVLGLCT